MISVIVPVYNVAPYISFCVNSIINQTYSDIEIILIDDGSTDESGNICDKFAEKDSRISVIHQQNMGPAAARNAGTVRAQGDYIAYIDGDDFVEKDYLKVLFEVLTKTNSDIAVCEHKRFTHDNEAKSGFHSDKTVIYNGRKACDQIVNHHLTNMGVIWGKLYKKSLREYLYMPNGKHYEDEFTTYKVLYAASSVAKNESALYFYRQRKGSLSLAPYSKFSFEKLEALSGAADFLNDKGERELCIHARKRFLLTIEIVWSKAYTAGEDKQVLCNLLDTHKEYYKIYGKEILKKCTLVEKITLLIFRISPVAYTLISRLYLYIFGENCQ